MINSENIVGLYKYFPHPSIRDQQKKIISDLYKFLHENECDGIIISAASGIGKEACMTSQALLSLDDNLFDKVIFAIPTDAGKENIIKELGNIKHNKHVMKVYSKKILCNWLKEKSDERISALEDEECVYHLCRLQGHKCRYKENECRYFLQKEEIKDTDVLICDYNYIISPFIRRASGFEELFQRNRTLLLIDECHMLKKRAEMILTGSISSTTIIRAIRELDRYGYKEEKEFVEGILISIKKEVAKHYSAIEPQMEKNYEGFGEVILQASVIQKFCTGLTKVNPDNIEDIGRVGEILINVGEEISKLKFEQKEGILSYSEMVGNFILRFYKLLLKRKEDSTVFFLKIKKELRSSKKKLKSSKKASKKDTEFIYIGWTPLDVRGFLRDAIKRAIKYVLYSGTIKSTRIRNDVGLAYERICIPENIESPYLINRKDIILTKERFCFQNLKNESFSKRIIDDLDKLFPNMEKPIGIVCTNLWYENLGLSSIYDILNEPETQEEMEHWLNNLVSEAQFIRFSPYGRIGQSIDLSYLKSIIFLGVPYPKYDPIAEEKISKIAKKLKGKTGNRRAKAIYIQIIEPTYERIVQSVMRGLRNENDRLNVLYYDINFKLNKPALGSKNLVVCNTIDEVISHLSILK